MAKTKEEIKEEIITHIKENCYGEYYSDYYVGVTDRRDERLFTEHNVAREKRCYIIRKPADEETARGIEEELWEDGMIGGLGGPGGATYLYVYRISKETIEPRALGRQDVESADPEILVYSGRNNVDRFWKVKIGGVYQLERCFASQEEANAAAETEKRYLGKGHILVKALKKPS